MRIGILTHYEVNNQGAQLQMYALSEFLRSHGHEAVILTYEKNFDLLPEEGLKNNVSLKSAPYYLKNYLLDKGIGLFAHNALKYEKLKLFRIKQYTYEPFDSHDLDAVIIGSDEVFSIDVGINKMMYGIGLNTDRVIAYAPAFGKATIDDLKENHCYEMIRDGLSGFTALSARDTHTQDMIYEMTGRKAPIVSDPVILMDFDQLPVYKNNIKKPYVLVYSYDANMKDPKEYEAIQAFARRHHLLTVSAGTYHKWCDINVTCDPLEWIQYFRDAEFIITDTFHGFVTSLKTRRPFALYVRNTINPFKMRSLMEQTDTSEREFNEFSFANLERIYSEKLDYDHIEKRIDSLKTAGEKYLLETLKTDYTGKNISSAFHDTYCSGCAACASVCPVKAIDLKKNQAGYYEAYVNEDTCIHCGKCVSVCHRFSSYSGKSLYKSVPQALQSSNPDTVFSSSSGGIAHEIARNALLKGYCVVGCHYNYDQQEAEHMIVDDAEKLDQFRGSKYLQSNAQHAFAEMIRTAQENSEVKYTVFGTPCQIAGALKATELLHIRDQFLFVEIFCHGVPTYKLWDYQKEEIEIAIGAPIEHVSFRDKQFGWHTYCLKAKGNENEWSGTREKTEFWLSYFEDGLLNRSCMVCKARGEESSADIRIGDYWGSRYAERTDGVSVAFAVTDKGRNMIDELIESGSVITMECGTTEEILSAQNMKGYTITAPYKKAQEMLENGCGLKDVINTYHQMMPIKKKVKRTVLKTAGLLPDQIKNQLKVIRHRINDRSRKP